MVSLKKASDHKKVSALTVLITGARAPIALEMARSFKRKGHRVIMVDCQYFSLARWSNTVDRYYRLPSPRFNQEGFIKRLRELIQEEHVDHLIPTCEEALFISAYHAVLPCKVWTSNQELSINLHNKYFFAQEFQHLLPIPKTVLVKDFKEWPASKDYVFKAVYSRFASAVFVQKQIDASYFKDDANEKWVAQQFIAGKEVCVYSIWEEGVLKAFAAYHPLYRAGKGAGIFFEPVHNTLILDYVQRFGVAIKYHGQLCFDVIIDQYEQPYFIECNPRGTSGAHLLHDKLVAAFLDKGLLFPDNKTDFSIKYAMALLHSRASFAKRVRQSSDIIFSWTDLKPSFFQMFSLIEIVYIKLTKKMSLLEATTTDIEWNEGGD